MNITRFIGSLMIMLFLSCSMSLVTFGEMKNDTDIGIQFGESTSNTIDTSETTDTTDKVPINNDKDVINKSGNLPQTGEIAQSLLVTLIGWIFLLLLILIIYIKILRNNKNK